MFKPSRPHINWFIYSEVLVHQYFATISEVVLIFCSQLTQPLAGGPHFLHWNFRLILFEPWSWNFYNLIIFYVKCQGTFLPIAHRCWIQFILCRTCLLGERSKVGKFERISIDKRVITVAAHQGQPVAAHQGQPGPPSTPISLHFQVPSF